MIEQARQGDIDLARALLSIASCQLRDNHSLSEPLRLYLADCLSDLLADEKNAFNIFGKKGRPGNLRKNYRLALDFWALKESGVPYKDRLQMILDKHGGTRNSIEHWYEEYRYIGPIEKVPTAATNAYLDAITDESQYPGVSRENIIYAWHQMIGIGGKK